MNRLLTHISSVGFDVEVGAILPPQAMRRTLLRNDSVRELKKKLGTCEISDAEIKDFVGDLVATFAVGRRFDFDVTLAAVVVALEEIDSPIAERIISDLSELQLAEMPLSPRVAKVSLNERNNRASIGYRVVVSRRHVTVKFSSFDENDEALDDFAENDYEVAAVA